MNEPWTKEEEVNQLQQRFDSLKSIERVSQAAFARANSMPGGASMITQHLKMTRPISLEHALVYARGFRCSLAEISPRLARLVAEGQATTGSTPALVPEPAQINERRAAYRVVSLEAAVEGLARHFESVDGYDKATAISPLSNRPSGGFLLPGMGDLEIFSHILCSNA